MDQISEQRIAQVHPALAALIAKLDSELTVKGIQVRVVQGLRTFAEQDALYAEGRTKPGRIVTNARGGYSAHNFGYAVDLIPGVRGKDPWEPNWNAEHPDFTEMVNAGVALGLVSGSRWTSIKDEPHFQLAGMPVTPTEEMREYLKANTLQEFWAKYVHAPEQTAPVPAKIAPTVHSSAQ